MKVVVFVMAFVVLGACSTPPPAANDGGSGTLSTADETLRMPAYMAARQSCAVVVGGSVGTVFPDARSADYWHQMNTEVAGELHDRLLAGDYRTVALVIAPAESQSVRRLSMEALTRNRCNRLINLSNAVDEDVRGRFFRYDITVTRIEQKGDRAPGNSGISITAVTDYKRSYRFARTPETFDRFRAADLAATVFAELKASGVIDRLR